MKLDKLTTLPAYSKARKRVGRGPGSGHGKTSGRGHKGSKARTSGTVGPLYEGGQMPLHRRLPKRGFTNIFKKRFAVVNVGSLNFFSDGDIVDSEKLKGLRLIRGKCDKVRILGDGELKKRLTVKAVHFTKSAEEKIVKAGGKAERVS